MADWIKRMSEDVGKESTVYDEFSWILNSVCTQQIFEAPEYKDVIGRFCDKVTTRVEELFEARRCKDPIIEDGFGSAWSKRCPLCNELSMQVMRPGSVQCGNGDCPQWQEGYGDIDGD